LPVVSAIVVQILVVPTSIEAIIDRLFIWFLLSLFLFPYNYFIFIFHIL